MPEVFAADNGPGNHQVGDTNVGGLDMPSRRQFVPGPDWAAEDTPAYGANTQAEVEDVLYAVCTAAARPAAMRPKTAPLPRDVPVM